MAHGLFNVSAMWEWDFTLREEFWKMIMEWSGTLAHIHISTVIRNDKSKMTVLALMWSIQKTHFLRIDSETKCTPNNSPLCCINIFTIFIDQL